ncbi:MAG: hypothetical protein IJK81_04440 [Selenomonadaceae bacterium]|nr:hypothetical protein [Selenomonadaceae bacterium]
MGRLNNERGFMLLNVIFLTLITSFAAMLLMNAMPRVRNPQSVLKLTAIHLANEQLAMIESKAADGELDLNYLGKPEDLTTENFSQKVPTTFNVTSTDKPNGNLHSVTVKVEWTANGREDFIELERTIRVVPK